MLTSTYLECSMGRVLPQVVFVVVGSLLSATSDLNTTHLKVHHEYVLHISVLPFRAYLLSAAQVDDVWLLATVTHAFILQREKVVIELLVHLLWQLGLDCE